MRVLSLHVSFKRTWMVLFPFSFFVILVGTVLLYKHDAHPAVRNPLDCVYKSLFPGYMSYQDDTVNGSNLRGSGYVDLLATEWNMSTYPSVASRKHTSISIPKTMSVSALITESHALPKFTTVRSMSSELATQPSHQASVPTAAKDHCDVHGIEPWNKGVITQLEPPIKKNCNLLLRGDRDESVRVSRAMKQWKDAESEQQWIQRMSNCSKVIREFTNNFYVSPTEKMFPLAYILVVYKDARQVVRLLKAIYRSHNLYCIHPDARQGESFARVFRLLSRCLDNVFVASKLEKVYYQHHTIMDSQINCYEDLMTYEPSHWIYIINICGTELPLKTNREIVNSLKGLHGASAVDINPVKQTTMKERFLWKETLSHTNGKVYLTKIRLGPPPHNIKIYKSTNFIAATRPFINFILHNGKAIDFRNYLKDVKVPEEHFYASLARLQGVPGGTPRRYHVPVIDEYIWMTATGHTLKHGQKCFGKMVHFICIVTLRDLPKISHLGHYKSTPRFFLNKYDMRDDHVVMDCMEERLIKQNIAEYKQDCSTAPSVTHSVV